MSDERTRDDFLRDRLAEEDEIEIIEVVGLDDDAPPESADDDETVVAFDEAATSPPGDVAEGSAIADGPSVPRESFIRLWADFENLKKRVEREKQDHSRHATGGLVTRLLPVLDNLERALASSRSSNASGPLVDGVAMILRQFKDALREEGLVEIESLGRHFDPRVHEAMATEASPGIEPNLVVHEFQRGYFFHERVLRPALVRVSVGPDGDPPPEEGGDV